MGLKGAKTKQVKVVLHSTQTLLQVPKNFKGGEASEGKMSFDIDNLVSKISYHVVTHVLHSKARNGMCKKERKDARQSDQDE